MLKEVVGKNTGIWLTFGINLDNRLPLRQFIVEGFTPRYKDIRAKYCVRPNNFHKRRYTIQTVIG